MKKQTAVEWLLDNLDFTPYSESDFEYNEECWNKAIAMERDQIIDLLTKYHDRLFFIPLKDGEADSIYNHLKNEQ